MKKVTCSPSGAASFSPSVLYGYGTTSQVGISASA